MDTNAQLYEQDATGWQRGLYDDVRETFRAPIVNWIFRTLMANEPEAFRYLWGQIKPAFGTKRFGRLTVEYRDTLLSAADGEGDPELPVRRREDLGVSPAEYAALRGQIATFDVVSSRLAVLFELADRGLGGGDVGTDPDRSRAATEPLPAWLDADRGDEPTMIAAEDVPPELDATVEEILAYHGLDEGFPSIYRCLAQWPPALESIWSGAEPLLRSTAFEAAREEADALVREYVESLPYVPALSPVALRDRGFDDETIDDLGALFESFNAGPVRTVLPALPVYAASIDVAGERTPL